MSLKPGEYSELHTALVDTFDIDDLEMLFLLKFNKRLEDYVATNNTKSYIVFKIIDLAVLGNWIPDLIQQAMIYYQEKHDEENAPLINFLQTYTNHDPLQPQPVAANHYETCFVRPKLLFINRQNLRTAIKQLREDDDSSRVFLVKGDPKTGKTYTKNLILYLEDKPVEGRNETHKTIYIDLKSSVFTPFRIAETIGRRLGSADVSTIPQQGSEQMTAYSARIVDWIHEQVRRTPDETVWWIVFDHFVNSQLLSETKELIHQTALRVEDELRKKCRLVILDYENNIPLNIVRQSICETVETINREHLIRYLDQLFELKEIDNSEGEIEAIVDTILNQVDARIAEVPNNFGQRWDFLYEAVSNALERYKL